MGELITLFGTPFVAWYLRVSGLTEEPQPPAITAPVRRRSAPVQESPVRP